MNRPALLDFDEALAQLLDRARVVCPVETVETLEALDRVLADDQRSLLDVPLVVKSQIEGWAVRVEQVLAATQA